MTVVISSLDILDTSSSIDEDAVSASVEADVLVEFEIQEGNSVVPGKMRQRVIFQCRANMKNRRLHQMIKRLASRQVEAYFEGEDDEEADWFSAGLDPKKDRWYDETVQEAANSAPSEKPQTSSLTQRQELELRTQLHAIEVEAAAVA